MNLMKAIEVMKKGKICEEANGTLVKWEDDEMCYQDTNGNWAAVGLSDFILNQTFKIAEDKSVKLKETISSIRKDVELNGICPDCWGEIKIRNPTGRCDHLHYPEYKKVEQ